MNLRTLSDDSLVSSTLTLVQQERETLTQILRNLREIENRRLYASEKYKCKSLFQFVVEILKYPEDQAARRIAAMRLLRELPEIEAKIEEGTLNLTNLGLAQTLFKKEKPTREEKIQILEELEGKSTREAARIIHSLSKDPIALRPDLVRELGDDKFLFEFVGDSELMSLIEEARGLLSHAQGSLSMNELLKILAQDSISKRSPAKRRTRKDSPAAPRGTARRNPTSATETHVWQKAESKCESCGSTYKLEVDHVTPYACGGTSERENLRLLCRSCNERAAIEAFGQEKMRPFFNSVRERAVDYQH